MCTQAVPDLADLRALTPAFEVLSTSAQLPEFQSPRPLSLLHRAQNNLEQPFKAVESDASAAALPTPATSQRRCPTPQKVALAGGPHAISLFMVCGMHFISVTCAASMPHT
jgi:hypothetical protein